MKSKVFFADIRAKHSKNLFSKLKTLLNKAGISECVNKRDLTAIKLHFGEKGNAAYIRPVYLRQIVEIVKNIGASPFLTDSNTLYSGARSDAPSHINTAIYNGFSYSSVDAPIIIADGLRGKSDIKIEINQKNLSHVYIGKEIIEADALISVAHFKGHELSGFGGAIKNMGMGCASRRGKLVQHSTLSPKVKKKKCIGCGNCTEHCSQMAISLVDNKAVIDPDKCIGCSECILICPNEAIEIQWNQEVPIFMEKMVEYTSGIIKDKPNKCFYVNFINNISPACDCYPYNDAPIVRDIGIVASCDPVAIDQASVDLVNNEQGIESSCLSSNFEKGADKFKAVYPSIDWEIQLEYAQKIGIGNRNYELITI